MYNDVNMKLDKELNVSVSESEARRRINTYFEKAGYQPLTAEGSIITFQRGSRLGTWIPLSPSQLKCFATVRLESRGNHVNVKVNFDLGNVFKDETHFTEEFWTAEIKEFETALTKDEYVPLASKKLMGKTFQKNIIYVFSGLIWVLLWGVISFALIFPAVRIFDVLKLPYNYIFIVAIVIMIIAFFITKGISRYWRRRQNER
jgi:hypothetical protein